MDEGFAPPGPAKTVILTPAIAQLEKCIAELESVINETHPELQRVKQENEEFLRQRYSTLDKQNEHQRGILARQLQCEIQAAEEGMEDFISPSRTG
jgi:septal ring factor EnvC (AmiA/AmiB activator)